MSRNIRVLTYIIFLYTCIEGLVINITYPNPVAYVVKDVVTLLVYLAMLTEHKGTNGSLSKLVAPIGAFTLVTLFFLLMPTPITFVAAAVGVKQKLFYIPLMYVGYHFMRDDEDLKTLLKVMSWSAIPVSIFGIYLHFTGPAGLHAIGANYSAEIHSTAGESGSGAFYRVPGTFTSPGQFGAYLMVHAILNSAVIFMPGISGRHRALSIVSFAVVMGALLASGSRMPLLATFMCVAFLLVAMGKLSGLGTWAAGAYSVMTVAYVFFGASVRDRVDSIAAWEHVDRFRTTYFGQMFMDTVINAPLGIGIGVATNGARHFTNPNDIIMVESYFAIIGIEMGILGLLIFAWLVIKIIAYLVGCFPGIRRAPARALWYGIVSFLMFTLLLLPVGTPLDAMPTQLYFWFFLGVAARLYDTEQWRLWQARQTHAANAGEIAATPLAWAAALW